MGVLLSILQNYLFPSKSYRVVCVGLDGAGKTTMLYQLHLGEVVQTSPTIGSNVEEVTYGNVKFEVWDLGGGASMRGQWEIYYRGTDAVILMVDSTDRGRLSAVVRELDGLLENSDLSGAVLLVFANKQDLGDALTVAELTEMLSLHAIKSHTWKIQACSAKENEGLQEGLSWLAQNVQPRKGEEGRAGEPPSSGAGETSPVAAAAVVA
eukprot:CAMPEP_0170142550 /NCGR_PEP_ID=MMETSP0033_2-20121228/7701_1 /TAXON_ID=195969 /ORGANISM="Dolichomastix tenuilepis, Strain CCMP3274" /LENGTH=208 /DNA_ID=CAMNT_0010378887 /DNA_START=77 /DNA_END=703 /DNA_ORIENTATION=+